ncbi:MAG: hypothetical protein WBP34_15020 [Thermoanaerobaculia bacterium]
MSHRSSARQKRSYQATDQPAQTRPDRGEDKVSPYNTPPWKSREDYVCAKGTGIGQ